MKEKKKDFRMINKVAGGWVVREGFSGEVTFEPKGEVAHYGKIRLRTF